MPLEDQFLERFARTMKSVSEQKEQDRFFLVYEMPDGSYREIVGELRIQAVSDLYKDVIRQFEPSTEIRYMCRRIGEPHWKDSKAPEVMATRSMDKLWEELFAVVKDAKRMRY
jgi:hypothetical protein